MIVIITVIYIYIYIYIYNVGYGNSTHITQFFKSIFPKDANVIMRFVVIL